LLEAVVCTLVLGVKFEASRLRPRQSFVFVAVSATALCFGLYRRAWAATSSAGAATRFQISAYALAASAIEQPTLAGGRALSSRR
jgi:hypothetical protein